MVKNVTINSIDTVDKNNDGKISKNEIIVFWNKNNGLAIKPQKKTIAVSIIDRIFPHSNYSGKVDIPKDVFIKSLKDLDSPKLKIIETEQGISITYC